MIDHTDMLPDEVRARVGAEVNRQIAQENLRQGRTIAVRIILALALASYTLVSMDTIEDEPRFFVSLFAVVAMLAGLLAADVTLRFPQLFAGLAAKRDPFVVSPEPTRGQKWSTVAASAIVWSLPLSAATGHLYAGIALAVALLPLISFISNVVLRATLAQWSGLPARVTIDLVEGRDPEQSPDYEG